MSASYIAWHMPYRPPSLLLAFPKRSTRTTRFLSMTASSLEKKGHDSHGTCHCSKKERATIARRGGGDTKCCKCCRDDDRRCIVTDLRWLPSVAVANWATQLRWQRARPKPEMLFQQGFCCSEGLQQECYCNCDGHGCEEEMLFATRILLQWWRAPFATRILLQ